MSEQLHKGGSTKSIEEGIGEKLKLAGLNEAIILAPVSAGLHRTIQLASFHFARVTVTITGFVQQVDADMFYARAEDLVQKYLDWEIAKIQKNGGLMSELQGEIDNIDTGEYFECAAALVFGIDYGLTIQPVKYESARADVGRAVPCKPEDLADVRAGIQDWLTQRIRERVKHIRSAYTPDGDLGI